VIILISASQVARATGVSHQLPAKTPIFQTLRQLQKASYRICHLTYSSWHKHNVCFQKEHAELPWIWAHTARERLLGEAGIHKIVTVPSAKTVCSTCRQYSAHRVWKATENHQHEPPRSCHTPEFIIVCLSSYPNSLDSLFTEGCGLASKQERWWQNHRVLCPHWVQLRKPQEEAAGQARHWLSVQTKPMLEGAAGSRVVVQEMHIEWIVKERWESSLTRGRHQWGEATLFPKHTPAPTSHPPLKKVVLVLFWVQGLHWELLLRNI
jgi:hypothetical protein